MAGNFPSFNWISLHAKLNNSFKTWSYQKKKTKIKKLWGKFIRQNPKIKDSY